MICRIYDVPGATLDQYDEVDRKIGLDNPEGLTYISPARTSMAFR